MTARDVARLLPSQNGVLLISACGIEDEMANRILLVNQSAKTQTEKSKKDVKEDKSTFEEHKLVIWMALLNTLMDIALKEKMINVLEAAEEEAYLASLAILLRVGSNTMCRDFRASPDIREEQSSA